MRNDLSNLFNDTVTLEAVEGTTLHGAPIYAEPVAHATRVIQRQRTVVGRFGDVSMSRSQVWFRDPVTVGLEDRITMPDGSTDSNILAIDASPDDAGNIFTKVYL